MTSNRTGGIVVVTTNRGRFVWWRALFVLDYVPKGRRRATQTWPIPTHSNSERAVVAMAGKALYDQHRSLGGSL